LISDNGMHVRFRCAIKATHLRGHDKGAKLDDVLGKRRHGPLRQSVLPIRSLTQAGEAESSTRRGQVRAGSASFDVCNTVPSAASAQTCFRSLKRRIPCNASRHGCGGQLYATGSACGLGLAALVSHGRGYAWCFSAHSFAFAPATPTPWGHIVGLPCTHTLRRT
jgi:hypothetical protein